MLIVGEQPGPKQVLKSWERKPRLCLIPLWCIPWEVLQKQFVDAAEEPLDFAASARNPFFGKDQFDAQIHSYLFHMFAGEVAAVISIEDTRDAADMPVGIFLAPDGLPKR